MALMSYVFISYAHTKEDTALAEKLEEWLVRARIDAWRDKSRIPVGVDFNQSIVNAIKKCDAAIFLVSQAWLDRDWTHKEIQLTARSDSTGQVIPRIGVFRTPRAELDVPAELSRFSTTDWVDGDSSTSDYARFYEIFCGATRREPGFQSRWDEEGRRLLGDLNAPSPAKRGPVGTFGKGRPGDYPSLECGRAREWMRVQMTYPEEQHQITVIAAAKEEAHDRFIQRIRRKLDARPEPAVRKVDWSPRPLRRDDFMERLLRGLTDDEMVSIDELPKVLSEILSARNAIVVHDPIDERHDDLRLVDYYTKWLPELLELARPNFRLKCIQPVAWQRSDGLRHFAEKMAGALSGNVPGWLFSIDERKAKELIGKIVTVTPVTGKPVPPVFLSKIDENDVAEFCTNRGSSDVERAALLVRTHRSERVRTSSDVLRAIDEYILTAGGKPAAEGATP
jgi:hypothetical protein